MRSPFFRFSPGDSLPEVIEKLNANLAALDVEEHAFAPEPTVALYNQRRAREIAAAKEQEQAQRAARTSPASPDAPSQGANVRPSSWRIDEPAPAIEL